MISSSKLRYLRIAPRKVRLVVDLVRGEKVERAQNLLSFTTKKAALPVLKLLNQALANAVNKNAKADKANLYISKIFVDGGPNLKRTLPRSRGRADVILKRSSHITIVLDEIKKIDKKSSKVLTPKGEGKEKTVSQKEVKEAKEIKEDITKTREQEKMKEKLKKRIKTERVKPKREKGLKRFFRRKAI